MKTSRSRRKKYQAASPQVPYWYYIALGAAALVGILLIAIGMLVRVDIRGITTEGDYFQGNPNAAVTIIDWGNYG